MKQRLIRVELPHKEAADEFCEAMKRAGFEGSIDLRLIPNYERMRVYNNGSMSFEGAWAKMTFDPDDEQLMYLKLAYPELQYTYIDIE